MADHLYDVKRLLLEAAQAEPDQFKATRRLGRVAAALAGGALAAGGAQLGCVDEELGAFGGVADIPEGLWQQQQWSGRTSQPTPASGQPLLRLNLPRQYARDWTVQLATPQVPSGAALAVPSTFAATVRVRWGHHGSTDEAIMTWPELGGTFVVHGCFLELFVIDTTPATPAPTANYTAWLTEGAGARGGVDQFQPSRQQLAAGTLTPVSPTQLFILSPRAKSLYIVARSSNPFGVALDYTLLDNLVARFSGFVQPQGANTPLGAEQYLRYPLYIPPFVNAILFNNTTADNWDVSIVEMLDL